MTSEKDLILKGWENLDEDQVVREVATKGKYISLCLTFLSKKKSLSTEEAVTFFYQKVDVYCNRLIKNRQLFKAEHVMKNLQLDPQLIFFQKSQEIGDPLMQQYLAEHLEKQTETYHTKDEPILKQNWALFGCLRENKQLFDECVSENESEGVLSFYNLTFAKFYNQPESFKKNVALKCYFKCKEPNIADMLDRDMVWKYLLTTNAFSYIHQWIHKQSTQLAASDFSTHSSNTRLTINAKELNHSLLVLKSWADEQPTELYAPKRTASFEQNNDPFEQSLANLFEKWSINAGMVETLQQYNAKENELILNELARLGYFIRSEADDIEIILKRLFATECDLRMVRENAKINKCLIRYLLENRLFLLLSNETLVNHELLEEMAKTTESQSVVKLILSLKGLFQPKVTLADAISISEVASQAIAVKDEYFYRNNPIIKLFEAINEISFENYTEKYRTHFEKFPHLNAFVEKVLSASSSKQIELSELVQTSLGIDIKTIKSRLTNGAATDLYFGNPILSEKYGFKFKLNYTHYIRQYRSAYAIFIFCIEQLRLHSKISKPQIMAAVKKVGEIALSNHENRELCCHCVAFIEMLGVDSTRLRATLRCLGLVRDRATVTFGSAKQVALELEAAIGCNAFNLNDLEAMKIFCETFDLPLPQALNSLCGKNDWVEFLLLAEYLQFPVTQVLKLCRENFTDSNVGLNVWRALRFDVGATEVGKRKLSLSLKRRRSIKTELSSDNIGQTSHSSNESNSNKRFYKTENYLCEEYDKDFFAVLIQCTSDATESKFEMENFKILLSSRDTSEEFSNAPTSIKLLKKCIRMRWPLLAVFAADENSDIIDYCWLSWLTTSITANWEESVMGHCESFVTYAQYLIEKAVQTGFIAALHLSFRIFYPESPIIFLMEYLNNTYRHDFSNDTTFKLKNYLHTLNSQEMIPNIFKSRSECINYSIKLLVVHLDNNFQSLLQQQHFLESLCESDISYFNTIVDFCLLKQVLDIIEFTEVEISNFQFFCRDTYTNEDIRDEYVKIRNKLMAHKHYDKALALSSVLKMDKDNIIYQSWVNAYESDADNFDMDVCEAETQKYGIKPILMLNFYIYLSKRLTSHLSRYRILKKTLDIIKRYQLYYEFDRDAIEYEMLLAYVKFETGMDTDSNCSSFCVELEIYHSEYHENVFTKERGVLHNSFVELKEIAGIDDLTVVNRKLESPAEIERLESLIHALLDKGDIIQALRCQAIFDQRPIDLHFIVFCMALAEDIVTLYDLPKADRRLLNENLNIVAIRFNKRTLRRDRISQSSMSTSPSKQTALEASDTSGGLLDFEEIPSRDKQDVLEAIEGLASQIQHGVQLVRRVLMVYRASMYLDKDYTDILKIKKPEILLRMAVDDDCLNKLVVLNDIMTSMEMTAEEIADYISQQIAASIIQSRFYILQNTLLPSATMSDHREMLWGFDLHDQFHLILELCPNTTLLGHHLLEYCESIKFYRDIEREKVNAEELMQAKQKKTTFETRIFTNLLALLNNQILSHKKQNTINVELLIKAHDAFVHECSMEGIVNVLQKCKTLNNALTNAKSWNLIVKLLVGIGRFGEMYYCFDSLIKNDQFESLLGQFNEKHTKSLKTAIISYLNEHYPGNNEYYRLAAFHFLMYKELAEMWEFEAKHIIIKIILENETAIIMEKKFELSKKGEQSRHPKISVPYLRCSASIVPALSTAMDDLTHATENHLLDNQLSLAQKLVCNAELVALQLNLISKCMESSSSHNQSEMLCLNVLSITTFELLQHIVNYELSVPQSLILGRSHTFNINWTEAIYIRYVLMGDEKYFKDYLERMDLSENMIENIVKNFQLETKITKSMESAITKILEMIPTVTLRYRLASVLGIKRIISDLINGDSTYYMKDTDYGRKNEEL